MSARETPGCLTQLINICFWFIVLLVVLGGGVYLSVTLFSRLDREICAHCRTTLAELFPDKQVSVRSARRAERGIEVRGVRIADGNETEATLVIEVEELLIECSADWQRLLQRDVDVQGLVLRRPRVRVERRSDGNWSWHDLLGQAMPSGPVPEIRIEDGDFELRDRSARAAPSIELRDLSVALRESETSIRHDPARRGDAGSSTRCLELDATLSGNRLNVAEIHATLDPRTGSWQATGTVHGMEVTPAVLGWVLEGDEPWLADTSASRGVVDSTFVASRADRTTPVEYAFSGDLKEGRVEHPALPNPLTHVRGSFGFGQDGLTIKNLSARAGLTQVQLELQLQGFEPHCPLQVDARVEQLEITPQLIALLPDRMRGIAEKFAPHGVIDVQLHSQSDDQAATTDVTLTCRDVSFIHPKFPYRVEQGTGDVVWRQGRLQAHLLGRVGGQVLHLTSDVSDPGPQWTGTISLYTDGAVSIDDKLIAALPEKPQEIVRSLHPVGRASLQRMLIVRDNPAAKATQEIELGLEDAEVNFDGFRYPIDQIAGQIALSNGRWSFEGLQGRHRSARIVCNGRWDPAEPHDALVLQFEAGHVPLDDELHDALKPQARQVWELLAPRGTLDVLEINVAYDAERKSTSFDVHGEKESTNNAADGTSIVIRPKWFPISWDHVRGQFDYSSRDGITRLVGIRSEHGSMRVSLDAECRQATNTPPQRSPRPTDGPFRDAGWELDVTQLTVDRFDTSRNTVEFLPEKLRVAINQLDVAGPINLSGTMQLRGNDDPERTSIGWNVLVDAYDIAVQRPQRFEHIHGGVRLIGTSGPDEFHCDGQLEIDSLLYRGLQLTNIRGPLWFDNDQILLGSKARRGSVREPDPITANAFGGGVALDGQALLESDMTFNVEMTLRDADLQRLSREFTAGRQELSGKGNAVLRLNGTSAGAHKLEGDGFLHLRNADIYQLPLMVALLKLLSIRNPDTTAFTNAEIEFHVADEHVHFDKVVLRGDAISLYGENAGTMNFSRQLNVKLYSKMGRREFSMPLLNRMMDEASRNILEIDVTGTLENPQIRRAPFPNFAEGDRQSGRR